MSAVGMRADAAFRDRYGPWAAVTGASSGIGLAIAGELASRGLDLVLVARRAEVLADVASKLSAVHPVACEVLPADLATVAGRAAVRARIDTLDVGLLVHAAGYGTAGSFLATDPVAEAELLQVNAQAALELAHALAPRLAARGRGGLVLMSSIVAFQGVPRAANYAASKAYVQSLAEALAIELRPHGVDVLASAPGPVHSAFAARAGMDQGRAADPATVAAATVNALGRSATVRPGLLAKFLGGTLSTAPRALRVRIMAAIMAGMTRDAPGGARRARGAP
jgi:short-subunit dehydrogenase